MKVLSAMLHDVDLVDAAVLVVDKACCDWYRWGSDTEKFPGRVGGESDEVERYIYLNRTVR